MSAEGEPRTWDGTELMRRDKEFGSIAHNCSDDPNGAGAVSAFEQIKFEREAVGGTISGRDAEDLRRWTYGATVVPDDE
jgi:hypothetical protein